MSSTADKARARLAAIAASKPNPNRDRERARERFERQAQQSEARFGGGASTQSAAGAGAAPRPSQSASASVAAPATASASLSTVQARGNSALPPSATQTQSRPGPAPRGGHRQLSAADFGTSRPSQTARADSTESRERDRDGDGEDHPRVQVDRRQAMTQRSMQPSRSSAIPSARPHTTAAREAELSEREGVQEAEYGSDDEYADDIRARTAHTRGSASQPTRSTAARQQPFQAGGVKIEVVEDGDLVTSATDQDQSEQEDHLHTHSQSHRQVHSHSHSHDYDDTRDKNSEGDEEQDADLDQERDSLAVSVEPSDPRSRTSAAAPSAARPASHSMTPARARATSPSTVPSSAAFAADTDSGEGDKEGEDEEYDSKAAEEIFLSPMMQTGPAASRASGQPRESKEDTQAAALVAEERKIRADIYADTVAKIQAGKLNDIKLIKDVPVAELLDMTTDHGAGILQKIPTGVKRYTTVKMRVVEQDCLDSLIAIHAGGSDLKPVVVVALEQPRITKLTGLPKQAASIYCRTNFSSACNPTTLDEKREKLEFDTITEKSRYNVPQSWHGVVYTTGLQVFRANEDQQFKPMAEFSHLPISVIACSPYNMADPAIRESFTDKQSRRVDRKRIVEQTIERIKVMLRAVYAKGHRSIVIPDFGCEDFKNQPELMAHCFNAALKDPEFQNVFKQVVFAVGDKASYHDFASVLDDNYGPAFREHAAREQAKMFSQLLGGLGGGLGGLGFPQRQTHEHTHRAAHAEAPPTRSPAPAEASRAEARAARSPAPTASAPRSSTAAPATSAASTASVASAPRTATSASSAAAMTSLLTGPLTGSTAARRR
jgi:hypothetical protein